MSKPKESDRQKLIKLEITLDNFSELDETITCKSIGKALKYNDLSDIPSKLWSDVFDDIDAFYCDYPWPWFDNSNDAEEIYEMCRYFVDDAKGIYWIK